MQPALRTILSLLLSLSLAILPVQSFAMPHADDHSMSVPAAEKTTHCMHHQPPVEQSKNTCCEHCDFSCVLDCSQHISPVTLQLTELLLSNNTQGFPHAIAVRFNGRVPPPPLPPPLI